MIDDTCTPAVDAPEPTLNVPAQDDTRPQASRYATAGRLGAERVHQLLLRGKQYEQEHGLSAGRQRVRQLIQLGRRFEEEHGLAMPEPKPRQSRGEVWQEFLRLLALVVKPAYQPEVQRLVVKLADGTGPTPEPVLFDGDPSAA